MRGGMYVFFFFSSRRRHTRFDCDWSSDVCSSDLLDYELELALVLKKSGKHFDAARAAEFVGGYVIFNDVTARDIQRTEMKSGVFSFCKGIDTFCPLGPHIVTVEDRKSTRLNSSHSQIS